MCRPRTLVLLLIVTVCCYAEDCPGRGKPLEDENKNDSDDDNKKSEPPRSCEKHNCPDTHKCFRGKCCPPVNDFTVAIEIAGKKISLKRTDCIEGQPLKDKTGVNLVCGDFFGGKKSHFLCPKGYECVEHLDHSVCCPPPGNATKRWAGSCEGISDPLNFGLGCMMPFAANLGLGAEKLKKDPSYRSQLADKADLSEAYGISVGSDSSSGKQEFDQLVPGGSNPADRRRWNGRLKELMCGWPMAKLDECLNDPEFFHFDTCQSLGISALNILQHLNLKCGRYPEFDNDTLAGTDCIGVILTTKSGEKCLADHGQKGLEKEFLDGPAVGYPSICGGLKDTFDCLQPLVKSSCKDKAAEKHFDLAKTFYDSVFSVTLGAGCVLKGVGVY